MSRLGFLLDVSNYDGALGQNAQCLVNQGCAGLIPRISLERPALTAITVQQFQDAQTAQLPTYGGYVWCYGQDTPEAVIDASVQVIDPYTTYKILWMDVEDLQNFLQHHLPQAAVAVIYPHELPARFRIADPTRGSLALLAPAAAVAWLQRAQAEAERLGYLCGIYSAQYAWGPLTGSSTAFSGVPWWVADGDGVGDPTVFLPVGGIQQPLLKQYIVSSQGLYLCLPNPVDVSVADLDQLVAIVAPPSSPDPCAVYKQAITSMLGRAVTIQGNLTMLVQDGDGLV